MITSQQGSDGFTEAEDARSIYNCATPPKSALSTTRHTSSTQQGNHCSRCWYYSYRRLMSLIWRLSLLDTGSGYCMFRAHLMSNRSLRRSTMFKRGGLSGSSRDNVRKQGSSKGHPIVTRCYHARLLRLLYDSQPIMHMTTLVGTLLSSSQVELACMRPLPRIANQSFRCALAS